MKKVQMELIIDKLEDLPIVAEQLIQFAGDRKKWIFKGEIGAGKTTLIQSICRALGVSENVTSPTFSLINEYNYKNEKGLTGWVYHIDLYRLKCREEAIDIGIDDYLYDDKYCFIEWPQIIQSILPDKLVEINLEIIEDSKRKIIFL